MEKEIINYQRIEKAIEYLAENFKDQPNLDEVAEKVHLSPFHFQRLFTEWAGVSPKKFLQFLTVGYLREKIHETSNILELADSAGLSSQSRVYDLFVTIEGVTPAEYKQAGKGLTICYGYHSTPFGMCLIAVSQRGICGLSFVDEHSERTEFEHFKEQWYFAELIHDPVATHPYIQQIFSNQTQQNLPSKFHLLVQGTPFQVKVWEALLRIPPGSLATYDLIAKSIGNGKASRAVGSAIGNNPIGYLIPCHRVIRKEGKLGQYRWGSNRKKALVGWELAQQEQKVIA